MNAAMPSLPARIVKRAEVDARPAAVDAALPAPPSRSLAKEARLLPHDKGGALVEVRCSCGEWTRLELHTEGNR